MKSFWLVIMLIFSTMASAADSRPLVKIGVVAPLTGASATIGDEITRTLNLLAENLKEPGKYSYQFVFEDGKAAVDSSPTTAVRKLTNVDGVKFFIVATSGEILQVGPLAERQDLLMIAPYATVPAVRKLGDRVFRTAIDVERGVNLLSSYIQKHGDLPLALLTEQHSFTSGVSDLLRKRLSDQIVADEEYLLDETDLRATLLHARAKSPKAYYLSCARPNTCANITNQARQIGITEQFYSFLHMSDQDFLKATPSSSNGIRFLAPPDDASYSTHFIEFKKKYEERYLGPPKIDFLMRSTYDAANAIISGVEVVGVSPSAVSYYLQSYQTQGALGLVRFDADGDIQNLDYVMKEVVGGTIQPVQ